MQNSKVYLAFPLNHKVTSLVFLFCCLRQQRVAQGFRLLSCRNHLRFKIVTAGIMNVCNVCPFLNTGLFKGRVMPYLCFLSCSEIEMSRCCAFGLI